MSEKKSKAKKDGQQRRHLLKIQKREEKKWRDLVTPEGAAIHLRLADVSERAGALLIDLAIMFGVMIAGWLIIWVGGWAAGGGVDFGILFAISMLFFFFVRNFYFVFFELGRRGATPGKRATGLRVMSRDGGQLTANAVFARNFMREVEVFLPLQLLMSGGGQDSLSAVVNLMAVIWVGIFLLLPFFNEDKLRGGDIIAGTWVIRAPKAELASDLSNAAKTVDRAIFQFTPEQVNAYGEHELKVLETVLRKSSDEVRKDVATRIRKKIEWEPTPNEDDLAFLNAYYTALRERLETRLLFGNRKRDKFDRSQRVEG